MELLSHYISHTSRIIALDQEELYALRVGFTNLAFRCKAVMSSILALAATCRCRDMVQHGSPSSHDMDLIQELFSFAEHHNETSLELVQDIISSGQNYDYVLANAALMVLYGMANYSLRIQMAESPLAAISLPQRFMPMPSQWIHLVRAAHLAYDGLLNSPLHSKDYSPQDSLLDYQYPCPELGGGHDEIVPEDGPTEETRQLLFPIIAATRHGAFNLLRERVESASTGMDNTCPELATCLSALRTLDAVVQEVFSSKASSESSCSSHSDGSFQSHFSGCLSKVTPWVRSYLARVTSATRPGPLRRTVTSFLNRVPGDFLNIVQAALDLIPPVGEIGLENMSPGSYDTVDLNMEKLLALEIYTHWLVLVMLLDGVWWIGKIGRWDLGRIACFLKARELVNQSWWPESMMNIANELSKHKLIT